MDLDLTRFGTEADDHILFTDEPTPYSSSVFRTVADLIANGGPSMVFQPIVHVDSRRLLGVEALSRFPSALGTQLWWELAASVGLTAELEISASRNALELGDATTRATLGWEFLGINISPQTLLDPRFDADLAEQLGHHVVLEVTEPRERTDWLVVRRYIDRTRELGCRIAINSLTSDSTAEFERLVEVAPEIIKLDVGYTAALVANRHRRPGAAENFLRKCVQSGVFVVAVGVEREQDLDMLVELGVEAAQGYAFGAPQPIESFRPAELGLGLDDIMSAIGWS
jgi:EAL domain-containing protein (putative c-di-GMP-specific phosphodiesterase class I)